MLLCNQIPFLLLLKQHPYGRSSVLDIFILWHQGKIWKVGEIGCKNILKTPVLALEGACKTCT